MTLELGFLAEARLEFEEAAAWYDGERRGLGEEFVLEVERVLELILETPERFPIAHRGLRRIRVRRFPYSVVYCLYSTRVVVFAVFHARRDPAVWKSRA